NLVGGSLGTLPILLSQTSRLGPPVIQDSLVYPLTAAITSSGSTYDPDLKTPYIMSWTFGLQREITKDMVIEARYVGNRALNFRQGFNVNEINLVENGFLNEFKLAQKNLQVFTAANPLCGQTGQVACSFAYKGLAGQAPLPITLAYFSGKV